MSRLVSLLHYRLRVFLVPLALALLASVAVACGGGAAPTGLLALVPDGYGVVKRLDVKDLLQGQGLEGLQDDFLGQWEEFEGYGIALEDVTEMVTASSDRGDSLVHLGGQFEWDDLRDALEDAGFDESTYKGIEVWEKQYGDTVALLEKRSQVAWGDRDAVRDVIQALDRGSGFLFEDADSDMRRALGRVGDGLQVMVEDECEGVGALGCRAVAHSTRRGDEEFTIALEWAFLFRSDSSAESGLDDIENYFDDQPRELDVEDVVQEGEFVLVRATMDEEEFTFSGSATRVSVRFDGTLPSTLSFTPVVIRPGTPTGGDISRRGERDYYAVRLEAGLTYTFETELLTLHDSELSLLDTNGRTELDSNDDYRDLESRIEYRVPRSGVYYVAVFGHDSDDVGSYRLHVTESR